MGLEQQSSCRDSQNIGEEFYGQSFIPAQLSYRKNELQELVTLKLPNIIQETNKSLEPMKNKSAGRGTG